MKIPKALRPIVIAVILLAIAVGCRKQIGVEALPPLPGTLVKTGDLGAPLLAGFAKEKITPAGPVFMAGFNPMRISRGAHDDLYVRTLLLKQGAEKLALVAVDCVGIQGPDIAMIKSAVKNFREDQVIIASTHTHSGPDTMGLWGIPPLVSGRSERYLQRIAAAVADTIAAAENSAVPVTASTAVYEANPSIMVNFREGEPEDHHMGLMVFRDDQGATLATLWTAVGHPETMWDDNHLLSADYPGRVCALIEKEFGGGAIFVSGDLGAMMSPARPDPGQKHDWARLERVSQKIFADVKRGRALLEPEIAPRLLHRQTKFAFPFSNDTFRKAVQLKLFSREVYSGNQVITEVNLIEIGSAQFVTFPGEVYPKLGLAIRAHQKKNSFQIGLADDELGYIIYPRDYGAELYHYETTMCAGPELSLRMEKAILELLSE